MSSPRESAAAPRGRLPLTLRRRRERWEQQQPTWRAARPALIADALRRAQARPSGNWYVLAGSRDIPAGRPFGRTIAGREVVAWRDASGALTAGPGACPHLGAPLRESRVHCGTLVCHWHGLRLDGAGGPGWTPYPAHDDGVLAWVRLDAVGGEPPLPRPVLPARPAPASALAAVCTVVGSCEPEDVVANRLDPWHGGWLHPYSFTDLSVVREPDAADDAFLVDVSFRVAGRAVVPVRAEFTTPGPRTVVMRILDGEGAGSVVETHATPLSAPGAPPRTAVIEAVVAASDRPGFALARASAPLLRPVVRAAAARLWRDDLAYAERRCALRAAGQWPPGSADRAASPVPGARES